MESPRRLISVGANSASGVGRESAGQLKPLAPVVGTCDTPPSRWTVDGRCETDAREIEVVDSVLPVKDILQKGGDVPVAATTGIAQSRVGDSMLGFQIDGRIERGEIRGIVPFDIRLSRERAR